MRDRRRRLVERLDSEARGGAIAGHEFGALLRRDHIVNIVERAAAAFVDDGEQPERPGAAIAQDQLGNRLAQFLVKGGQRLRRDAVLDDRGAQNAGVDDGLAAAVGVNIP